MGWTPRADPPRGAPGRPAPRADPPSASPPLRPAEGRLLRLADVLEGDPSGELAIGRQLDQARAARRVGERAGDDRRDVRAQGDRPLPVDVDPVVERLPGIARAPAVDDDDAR